MQHTSAPFASLLGNGGVCPAWLAVPNQATSDAFVLAKLEVVTV